MKNTSYLISVPEPCNENWNAMQPDAKGRFCHSCSKSVIDFSNKTDMEIRDILMAHKDQKVCGHFKRSQVNRPLNITVNLSQLPKNISSARAFAIALFLVFGTVLFSCTNNEGEKIDAIRIEKNAEAYTMGAPMPPVENSIEDTIPVKTAVKKGSDTTAYIEGEVSIEVPTIQGDTVMMDTLSFVEPTIMGGMAYSVINEPEIPVIDEPPAAVIQHGSPALLVYPNPGAGEVTIKYEVLKKANVRIDLFDMEGTWLKKIVDVKEQHEGKYNIPVNLSALPNGIYLLNMINEGQRYTERLVIEK